MKFTRGVSFISLQRDSNLDCRDDSRTLYHWAIAALLFEASLKVDYIVRDETKDGC